MEVPPRINLSAFPDGIRDEDLSVREKQLIDALVDLKAYAERQHLVLTKLDQYRQNFNAGVFNQALRQRMAYWRSGDYAEKIKRLKSIP